MPRINGVGCAFEPGPAFAAGDIELARKPEIIREPTPDNPTYEVRYTFNSPPLIAQVRDYLADLTDEQRLEFFAAIQADYCRECGRRDNHSSGGHVCQCWNDDCR